MFGVSVVIAAGQPKCLYVGGGPDTTDTGGELAVAVVAADARRWRGLDNGEDNPCRRVEDLSR
jgi:hypothetical protein